MAQTEYYSNNAKTTLTSAYTAGSGVLTVASTAGNFPVSVPFHVVVYDDTTTPSTLKVILEVTAITDSTHFVVIAEGTDTSAGNGCTVYQSLTKTAIDRIKADAYSQNQSGRVVGSCYVATDEGTASTSYVDLTTLDTCTFTLLATSNILITYLAGGYQAGGATGSNIYNIGNVDGSDLTGTDCVVNISNLLSEYTISYQYIKTGLAAGSHTVKIRHKTTLGTAHWEKRCLWVTVL